MELEIFSPQVTFPETTRPEKHRIEERTSCNKELLGLLHVAALNFLLNIHYIDNF